MYFLACIEKLKNKFKENCAVKICMIFYAFDFKEQCRILYLCFRASQVYNTRN